jgi:hypothetical protein
LNSPLAASIVSWSACSSTNKSCHSPESPSSRIVDLVRAQVALVEHRNLALGLAKIEEEFLLVDGGAHLHQGPRAQDVFLDRSLDPPVASEN